MSELWPQTAPLRTLEDLIEEHAEALEQHGGDLEAIPEIAALLAFDESEFAHQLERWSLKVLVLKADAEAAKIERVRIQARENRWTTAMESLKGYILRQMQGRRVPKFKTPSVSTSVANNSRPSVRAKDDATLETLFASGSLLVREAITYTIDSDAVIALWKQDEADLKAVLERILEDGGLERVRAVVRAEMADGYGTEHNGASDDTITDEVERRLLVEAAASCNRRVPAGILVTRGQHLRIS